MAVEAPAAGDPAAGDPVAGTPAASDPDAGAPLRFTLYSRSWCHLCEDMLEALRAAMARTGRPFTVDVVDVDADPALVARFDELVPVLYGDPAGPELCHYFLDEAALQRHLARRSQVAETGA